MKVRISRVFMAMAFMLTAAILVPIGSFAEEKRVEQLPPGMETLEGSPAPEMAETQAPGKDSKIVEMTLLEFIQKGGYVGYLIILLSVVSMGFIIDYSVRIRKSKILPQKDIDKLRSLIENRKLDEIALLEKERPSFLTRVTIAGLKEWRLGHPVMIKAMEDASEALTSGISRKIEHLNVIGNISPMLGLLGTVTGMLRCFNEISHVAGAIEPKQLAAGIFEALITTCLGLIVAIPSLYAYAVFKNRVDEYTGEAALTAEQLVTSLKSE